MDVTAQKKVSFGPRIAFRATGALWGRATPFLTIDFSVHLSSVLGRTELCHEVWTPGPHLTPWNHEAMKTTHLALRVSRLQPRTRVCETLNFINCNSPPPPLVPKIARRSPISPPILNLPPSLSVAEPFRSLIEQWKDLQSKFWALSGWVLREGGGTQICSNVSKNIQSPLRNSVRKGLDRNF